MSPRKKPKLQQRPRHGAWPWLGAGLLVATVAVAGATYALTRPPETLQTRDDNPQSPFNGERAFRDLEKIVAIGPRVSGTSQSAATREYIRGELTAAGLEIREHTFDAATPIGTRAMVNLTGVVKGSAPGIIILGNHYDTKYFPEFRFVGANDGGSTNAWMIEMGRTLGPKREGLSIWLCFFDGEEAFKDWTDTDSLYGSREYVRHLEETGDLKSVKAMINVDMIGDCYLGVYRDPLAPPWLINPIWRQAQRMGYDRHFLAMPHAIEDDHVPFRQAGIPALELIDFSYGPTAFDHSRTWHTPHDTLDKVCAGSLQAVGDVIYHALPLIEKQVNDSRPID